MKFIQTLQLRWFLFWRIPLAGRIRPRVIELTPELCRLRIPFCRGNRNHIGSMFFGVLCTAADICNALLGDRAIRDSGYPAVGIVKDFHAEFLKRVEGDLEVTCAEGAKFVALVNRAIQSGRREEEVIAITATVPSKFGSEIVARFTFTISVKCR